MLISCADVRQTHFDDGKLQSELTYKNGKLNGKAVWYFENGFKEQEAFYKDNLLEGTMKK